MNEWTFACDQIQGALRFSVITGACRSGKTTLGNLLGTCRNIDHVDEPWTPMVMPVLAGLGAVEERLAQELFLASVSEIFNESVHLRHANFRPNDRSSIYKQKSISEILLRITSINSRQDAQQFARERNLMLLLNLAETSPFTSFFKGITGLAHIILVIRKSDAVANDLMLKGWFADNNFRKPKNRIPYKPWQFNGEKWHLPWWVSFSEEDYFLSLSEPDRCFYYWYQLNQKSVATAKLKTGTFHVVCYEDLVENPQRVFNSLADSLDLKSTDLTESAIAGIVKFQPVGELEIKVTDKKLQSRIQELNASFGYD